MGVGTLKQSAQPVVPEQPTQVVAQNSILAVTDKQGNPLVVTVRTKRGTVKATVRGIDTATGKLILSCDDTRENRAAFPASKQPATDRQNEASTADAVQSLRDSENLLTITVSNKELANKIKNGQITTANGAVQLTQKQAQSAINGSKRTLLHIVDKKAVEKAQQIEEAKKQEEDKPWYKNWKIWALILLTIGLATLGILAFRKGGWLNKDKKHSKISTPSPVDPEPSKTKEPEIPTYTPTNTDSRVEDNSSTPSTPNIPGGNITEDKGSYEISGPIVTPPAHGL